MRFAVFFILPAGPALADPGHIANVAGHAHWLGAAAAGAALAIAIWAQLKGARKAAVEEAAEDAPDDAAQEA